MSLGKEISKGFYQVGYPYCDGGVMSGNPFWCKSHSEWEKQIKNWALEASWESLRYLLIFIDGRSFYGKHQLLEQLKTFVYQTVQTEQLLSRMSNNTLTFQKRHWRIRSAFSGDPRGTYWISKYKGDCPLSICECSSSIGSKKKSTRDLYPIKAR